MIMKKYQAVLELGTQLNIQNGDVFEENGILKCQLQELEHKLMLTPKQMVLPCFY